MRVLFEDGAWRLFGKDNRCDVQHHCTQPHGGARWWYYAYDGACGVCHSKIPDPILGLKLLHNWDR